MGMGVGTVKQMGVGTVKQMGVGTVKHGSGNSEVALGVETVYSNQRCSPGTAENPPS